MRRFFSRFSPRYTRSLVYMLQASEYSVSAYRSWLLRVEDFRTVEKRKQIDWSLKARVLYGSAWMVSAVFIAIAVAGFFLVEFPWSVALALLLMIANASALPYALISLVYVGAFVQRPLERRIIANAKKKLKAHPGIKIAIAGSYGKTTMREILKTVLSEARRVAAPPGSYNTPLGIATFVDTLRGDEEILIFELGEYYEGDIELLCRFIEPSIGFITGVNEAHFEKFKSLENTANTVFELAHYLGGKPLYVNGDSRLAKARGLQHATLYGESGAGEWRVVQQKTGLDGTSCTLEHGSLSISIRTKLLGLHALGPIAASAHLAQKLGLSIGDIESGIARTAPFEHRLEKKMLSEGVVLIDDSYNGNPDGVRAAVRFLSGLEGRRFVVTPGLVEMGDRAETVHKEIGREIARAGIEQVVLIRNSVTPWIEKGLTEYGYKGSIHWYDDGLSAYAALPYLTADGDIVLIQNDWPDQYA